MKVFIYLDKEGQTIQGMHIPGNSLVKITIPDSTTITDFLYQHFKDHYTWWCTEQEYYETWYAPNGPTVPYHEVDLLTLTADDYLSIIGWLGIIFILSWFFYHVMFMLFFSHA